MDGWDPMAADYTNKSFNSYDRGPGKNLPQDPNERKQSNQLFVRGIPGALNEQGVRNIFGEYGEVVSCRVRQTPNYSTSIAFVTMANVVQCSDVIQHVNGTKIHSDMIHVSFAKSKEEKDRDRYTRQEEDDVIKSLGSGRTVTSVESFDRPPSGNASRPSGYSSDTGHKGFKACEQCGKPGSPFKCGKCTVLYCSSECQTRNWGSHKNVCGRVNHSPSQVIESDEPNNLKPAVNGSHSSAKSSGGGNADSISASSLGVKSPPVKPEPPVQQSVVGTTNFARSSAASVTLPLNEPLKVKLVEFQSPARFYVQLADNADLLRLKCTMSEAIECNLFGLLPFKGNWTDFAVQTSTKLGVTSGEIYTVVCVDTMVGNQVMFSLNDGSDLGDKLVEATAALVDPNSKYRVWDSLHRYLNVEGPAAVIVEPSSVEGVDGFYAQVMSDALKPYIISFKEMESHMSEYGKGHQRDPNYKPSQDDFVLCPYEGSWSRAEVYQCKDTKAAIGFIDYGNLHVANVDDLLPLPRIFSHVPAIATKIHIEGIADSAEQSVKEQSVEKVKELLEIGTPVPATVKDLSLDTLSIDIFTPTGESVSSVLLAAGFAVSHKQPLEGSLVASRARTKQLNAAAPPPEVASPCNTQQSGPAAPSQQPNKNTSPQQLKQSSTRQPPHQQSDHQPVPRQHQNTNVAMASLARTNPAYATSPPPVTVKPLLDVAKVYTVLMRKMDGTDKFCVGFPTDMTRSLDALSKQLTNVYSGKSAPNIVKPEVGLFVVFEYLPNEWRRGYVLKVSSPKKMALARHLDFEGETTKVAFENIKLMLSRFADTPCQAHPTCKLKGVADPEEKNLMLKPYMQLPVQLQVCEYTREQDVYTVNLTYKGEPLKPLPVRKIFRAGKDVPFAALSTEAFTANIVEVNSPLDIHFTPSILADIQECLTTVASQGAAVKGDPPLTAVEPGEVVLLFCSEFGEWDRVIILENLSGGQVSVKSADFGAVYTESLQNTRALTEGAAKVPLRAIKCSLAGVGSNLTEDACNYCKRLKECTVSMQVVGQSEEVVTCMIIDANGENVNQMVLKLAAADVHDTAKPELVDSEHAVDANCPSRPPGLATSESSIEIDKRLERLESCLLSLQQEVLLLRAEKAQLM